MSLQFEINAKQYDEMVKVAYESVMDFLKEKLEKRKQDVIDFIQKGENGGRDLDDYLGWYSSALQKQIKASSAGYNCRFYEQPRAWYKDCEKILRVISNEYDTVVDQDKVYFYYPGKHLSYCLNSLSVLTGFTSGMFSFDSSFTTHDAKTESGLEFKIGLVDKKDAERIKQESGIEVNVVADFGLFNPKKIATAFGVSEYEWRD